MSVSAASLLACVSALIALMVGYRIGIRQGIKVSSANSKSIIDQLKNANRFASELREEDRADHDRARENQGLN